MQKVATMFQLNGIGNIIIMICFLKQKLILIRILFPNNDYLPDKLEETLQMILFHQVYADEYIF